MNAISDIEPTQMAQDVLTVLTLILVSAAVAGAALGVARIARLHKIVADASRPHRSGVLVPILGVIALAGSLAALLAHAPAQPHPTKHATTARHAQARTHTDDRRSPPPPHDPTPARDRHH